MRRLAALALVLSAAAALVVAEGIGALIRFDRPGTGLTHTIYRRWIRPPRQPEMDPLDATTRMITSLEEFERRLTQLRDEGVGVGNSPFETLRTSLAAINVVEAGCLTQKPNLRKTMSYLRSNLFNAFDPPTYFHDSDRPLPPSLDAFLRRFGVRQIRHSSNAEGERTTLPAVERPDRMLVAGDSVAAGAMLDDTETIASQLQAGDPTRQYVNIGVTGATAKDVVCALERAAPRHQGHVRGLVLVFCENDFSRKDPYGGATAFVEWLKTYRARHGIARVVLVYWPYIYNVVPEVTRIRGTGGFDFPSHGREKRELFEGAASAGFEVIDFLAIAEAEEQDGRSQFAPLALYMDHTHPSPLGVRRLVDRLRARGG